MVEHATLGAEVVLHIDHDNSSLSDVDREPFGLCIDRDNSVYSFALLRLVPLLLRLAMPPLLLR